MSRLAPGPRRLAPRVAASAAAALALALTMTSGAAGWTGQASPVQSAGDRGTDVVAIQLLLRHAGYSVQTTAVFDAWTVGAVQAFEAASALPVDGVVDSMVWRRLTPRLGPGSTGDAVRALQRQLYEKFGARVPLDGVFSGSTRAALVAIQRHAGLGQTAIAGPATWAALLWHFELPRFDGRTLCDYSVGNGPANWGTAAATAQVEAAARTVVGRGYGPVAVGDLGFEHGGDIAGHVTHERGLDVDLRPMRVSRDQCRWGTNWRSPAYDRGATRALVQAIRATAPGHVKLVYFNDPVLIREGLTRWYPGHDDHLHVRYCERWHPSALYVC